MAEALTSMPYVQCISASFMCFKGLSRLVLMASDPLSSRGVRKTSPKKGIPTHLAWKTSTGLRARRFCASVKTHTCHRRPHHPTPTPAHRTPRWRLEQVMAILLLGPQDFVHWVGIKEKPQWIHGTSSSSSGSCMWGWSGWSLQHHKRGQFGASTGASTRIASNSSSDVRPKSDGLQPLFSSGALGMEELKPRILKGRHPCHAARGILLCEYTIIYSHIMSYLYIYVCVCAKVSPGVELCYGIYCLGCHPVLPMFQGGSG